MAWTKNWFSNFEPMDAPFIHQDIHYWTAENFFQAMKTEQEDLNTRRVIARVTPSEAKKMGRKVKLRKDYNWDEIKFLVMEDILRFKFMEGTSWYYKLIATGSEEIVEWNNWNDRIWGKTYDGIGENHLGKILMKIREEYRDNGNNN